MGKDLVKAKVTNNSEGLYVLVIEDINNRQANVTILKPGESSKNSVEAFGVVDDRGNLVKATFITKLSDQLGSEKPESLFWKIRDGAEVEVTGNIVVPMIKPIGIVANVPGMVEPSTPEAWGIDGKNPVSGRVSLEHKEDARYASLEQQLQVYLQENMQPEGAKRVLEMVITTLEEGKASKNQPDVAL